MADKYSVKKLADASGVSVRTLHHYDEIGLLRAQREATNNFRYYTPSDVLLLQQILLYRQMGLGLMQIKAIVQDRSFDPLHALEEHRRALALRINETQALLETVDTTIKALKDKTPMAAKHYFKGFDPKKQQEYEDYLLASGRVSPAQLTASHASVQAYSESEWQVALAEGDAINRELAALLQGGAAPTAAPVQAVIARHFKWICRFWQPNAASYAGLADLYTEHEDFRRYYEAYTSGLTDYLRRAMQAYAQNTLHK